MNRLNHKRHNATLRSARVRSRVIGTPERPRLCVRITNRRIWVQIIDDSQNKTLLAVANDVKTKGSMTEQAVATGKQTAEAAKKAKINKVVLDRGSRLYHGRLQAFAEAARAAGLEL